MHSKNVHQNDINILCTIAASSPARSKTEAKSGSEPLNNDHRPTSACSHCAGDRNSMCYVCHQRELRNIPIYLAEERKKKEKLHERLLTEFQQKKAALLNVREKVVKTNKN